MAIEFREITVADKIAQVGELLREHYEELATHPALMVLKPDVERYALLEKGGFLFAIAAYDGGRMVGYSVCTLGTNLHYSDLVIAQNDVLFVSREWRSGRTGMRLIRETERQAAARGARLVIWHAKPQTTLEAILPRLGYSVQDVLYSKEL